MAQSFQDTQSPKAVQQNGIHLAGEKYQVFKADDRSLYSRKVSHLDNFIPLLEPDYDPSHVLATRVTALLEDVGKIHALPETNKGGMLLFFNALIVSPTTAGKSVAFPGSCILSASHSGISPEICIPEPGLTIFLSRIKRAP